MLKKDIRSHEQKYFLIAKERVYVFFPSLKKRKLCVILSCNAW